ncbi:MAG TPA: saccharopine dehydrogenase NADP-binding domain-containing protein [Dokdonella sp.]
MNADRRIAVYGAYGHTGRFVVRELLRRGWTPVASGRDARKLAALAEAFAGIETHAAAVGDAAALDRALDGTRALIHCAGAFLDTGAPLLDAALRARIHYLDVAAEQRATDATYARDAQLRAAGLVALPSMAFYGGLADLLATALLDDGETRVDAIDVAVALDSWHPTEGTRLTGERNHYRRWVIAGGERQYLADPPPTRRWNFPAPIGDVDVVGLPLAETITIARHLHCTELRSWMNLAPLTDLRDPGTPPPRATDAEGRSDQRFVVDVEVCTGGRRRRARAQGQDIYAVSAPLVVEAMERIVDGRVRAAGALAPGQAFDARAMLAALAERGIETRIDPS